MVQAFPKKWWVESDFTAPNFPLPLRLKGSGCHNNSILTILGQICIIVVNAVPCKNQLFIIVSAERSN
jgi:hypothetical protein